MLMPDLTFRSRLRLGRTLLLCLAAACRDDSAPPSYVRVRGVAPAVLPASPTPATLVVFWASWCAPCRDETPSLLALARDPVPGVTLAVVSTDVSNADVEAFFGGPPPPELRLRLDRDEAAARAFGVEGLPTTVLVVNGQLAARFVGPRNWSSRPMRRLLARLVAEGSGEREQTSAPR